MMQAAIRIRLRSSPGLDSGFAAAAPRNDGIGLRGDNMPSPLVET